jgi:hypothetical protein
MFINLEIAFVLLENETDRLEHVARKHITTQKGFKIVKTASSQHLASPNLEGVKMVLPIHLREPRIDLFFFPLQDGLRLPALRCEQRGRDTVSWPALRSRRNSSSGGMRI